MANSNKRPLAAFRISAYRRIADFILKVRNIVLNIGNDPVLFPAPTPDLLTVTTNVDDLEAAEALAQTRAAGTAAARDQKYELVLDNVHGLQNYVQNLADNAADELAAIALIEASGFSLKVRGVFVRPPLEARNGNEPGTVDLIARGGGPRTAHEWQSSNNLINWTGITPTIKAKTMVAGLVKLTTLYFRHRVIRSEGPEPWSQPVSIVVL